MRRVAEGNARTPITFPYCSARAVEFAARRVDRVGQRVL